MSLLLPSNSVLILHIKQASLVAKMCKPSSANWLDSDDIWIDDIFLRDAEEISLIIISDVYQW